MDTILVSFSGGRTSAYMSYVMKKTWSKHNLIFVFANTGQEHEKTLEFVNRCDVEWGLGVVWVEAVINQDMNVGTKHSIVNFKTACRTPRLFEDMCSKYGLPNKSYPHCTRELKLQTMKSYMSDKGKYVAAVGIRADEYRRVKEGNGDVIYPLVDKFVTKNDVMQFWSKQPFDLGIPEHQGNCTWCWKKSDKKLIRLLDDDPKALDVPKMLEEKYSFSGNGSDIIDKGARPIFRENRYVDDMIKMWKYTDRRQMKLDFIDDPDNTCDESCEFLPMW